MESTRDPWKSLVTEDRISEVLECDLSRRGQKLEVFRAGCVDGALGAAWTAEAYTQAEIAGEVPGLRFACYLLRALAADHCFKDGNKRAAWIGFIEVLAMLGLTVNATREEAAAFVNLVITSHLTGEDVLGWTVERLEALDLGKPLH